MGRLLIFLGILGIIGGIVVGVLGAFGSGFGFSGFQDAISAAVNSDETAASLCREGERLETERGMQSYTFGQGYATAVSYFCVNSDGVRREVTGEFAETLFGTVTSAIPGLVGGIGLSALLSTCGTGLLVIGIIIAVVRGRRGMQVVTTQTYGFAPRNDPAAPVFTVSTTGAEGDLTARLQQLQTALDKKLISQEEYDRLRKALLDRLH
jgi:hypothetical protein